MPALFTDPPNPNLSSSSSSTTADNDAGSYQQPPPPPVPSSLTATIDGDRGSTPPRPRPSSLLPSSCYPITLKFTDVCYRIKLDNTVPATNDPYSASTCTLKRILCLCCNTVVGRNHRGAAPTSPPQSPPPASTDRHHQEKTILHGISGVASPGEILAVLGPSGSGKSTLLNALAGRLHGHGLTGSVLANDKKVSKSVIRRTGFVAQDDCLYPHLTVRETLVFCAMLRMPGGRGGTTKEEKVAVVEAVIEELGLSKCADTVVGNGFIRGVSGGERKRVSIAHEMLLNPSLLILDEPTSGLDSTAAFSLVSKLVSTAKKNGKTIVLSVHQPSSRVYQALDRVMLLSEGRPLYFGKGSEAMRYFESVGFAPSFPMNPADFMLDLANGIFHLDGSPSEKDNKSMNVRQSLVSSYNNLLSPTVKSLCLNTTTTTTPPSTLSTIDSTIVEVGRRRRYSHHDHWHRLSTSISTWLNELTILFQRSLKERKHESFNSLRVLQVVAAALLAGIMWWHSDPLQVQDRLGLLFFVSIFWGVFPSMNAAFAFPQDRAIFLKERASGMYTLSSYFMARIVGDLPMELILPTIFMALVYWMTGLRPGLCAFALTVLVVLGYVLVAQGFGLAVGAMLMDAKRASTVVTITMLAFVLTGGFYVHKMPSCFSWLKYVSVTYYCYRLLIGVQYGDGKGVSRLLGCERKWSAGSAMCRFVEEDVEGQISVGATVGVLLVMFVVFRVIAYIALKRIKL